MQILKFSAPWCHPCTLLGAALNRLNIPTELVDIDADPEMTAKYRVRGAPTLVAVEGGDEIGRLVGSKSDAELKLWYQNMMNEGSVK